MRRALRGLGPLWQVQRHRHPAAAARLQQAALGVRGRLALLAEVSSLRDRVAELERDHLLLAAHVATLTGGTGAAAPGDAAAAHDRARLAAIASYEQRIGALEARAAARHPRPRSGRATIRRRSGERAGTSA